MSTGHQRRTAFLVSLVLTAALAAQRSDPDRDRDGLSDFQEVHKYRTDPAKADSDGDGVPDGDWLERREYQYVIRTVVQVMRPVTPEFLSDDYQDVRVLDETDTWVELEVVHYPFNTVGEAIGSDARWRSAAKKMGEWTAPGPTANWDAAMRRALVAALKDASIDADALPDKELVEQASKWLCRHAKYNDSFTTFVTAFDEKGRPYVPEELAPMVPAAADPEGLAEQWERDVLARGMFEHGTRGSCSSSATYLNGCLRALGVPTRIVLCIPIVDANDESELRLLRRGIRHRALQRDTVVAIEKIRNSWASHTFNEVWVDGRWRRLNYDRLGQDIREPGMFGIMTHVATFSDWADARMPATIGRRQTMRRYDDVFGGPNPYSTIALRDEFGVHCDIEQAAPIARSLRITGALWGDAEDAPDDVREWFRRNEAFGLVVRIEGARDSGELRDFLAACDKRVFLVADGHDTLGIGLDDGAWWFREDGSAQVVVRFGPADRKGLTAGVPYRFVTRNQVAGKPGDGAKWEVDADLRVVRPR